MSISEGRGSVVFSVANNQNPLRLRRGGFDFCGNNANNYEDSFMFTVNNENLHGVRKVAHYCLIMALNGAFYQVIREQKAAGEKTIDSFNEMTDDVERPSPSGLQKERSPWTRFAGIYYALSAAIAGFNNKYVLAMSPESMWEYLSTSSEHPRVSDADMATMADACGLTVEEMKAGMHAWLVEEDNKRIGVTEAVLDMVRSMQDAGSVEDVETLTADEQLRVMEKFVDGLIDRRSYLINTGLLFRNRSALGEVTVIKNEIEVAGREIKQLKELAEAA